MIPSPLFHLHHFDHLLQQKIQDHIASFCSRVLLVSHIERRCPCHWIYYPHDNYAQFPFEKNKRHLWLVPIVGNQMVLMLNQKYSAFSPIKIHTILKSTAMTSLYTIWQNANTALKNNILTFSLADDKKFEIVSSLPRLIVLFLEPVIFSFNF